MSRSRTQHTYMCACKQGMPTITEQMDDADNSLFHSIIANKHHVLQRYLPDNRDFGYNLRPRRLSKTLIDKTTELFVAHVIQRLLLTFILFNSQCSVALVSGFYTNI